MLISNQSLNYKLICTWGVFPVSIKGEPHPRKHMQLCLAERDAGHQQRCCSSDPLKRAHSSPRKKESGRPGLRFLFADNSKTFWTEATACPHQFLQVTPGVQRRWRSHQQTAQRPSPERHTAGERAGALTRLGHSLESWGGGRGRGLGREGLGTGEKMSARCLACAGHWAAFHLCFLFNFPKDSVRLREGN